MRPPAWIYPPEDFEPFSFSTDPLSIVLNVESMLGRFRTPHRWLRIATMELSATPHPNNYLRLVGPGWGGLSQCLAPGGGDGAQTHGQEIPVFVILPPLSDHEIFYLGQTATDLTWRITGWGF